MAMGNSVLAPRIPTEHEEQRQFVCWFRSHFPGVRIFAIPNGGYRGRVAAARMKAEGVLPGVPDLFVPAWLLWIEMKRIKNSSTSPEQVGWKAYLETVGHTCLICKGAQDAMQKSIAFAIDKKKLA